MKGPTLPLTLLLRVYLRTPVHSTPTANVWNHLGNTPNKFLGVRTTVEGSLHRQPLSSPPDSPLPPPALAQSSSELEHWGWGVVGNQKRVSQKGIKNPDLYLNLLTRLLYLL